MKQQKVRKTAWILGLVYAILWAGGLAGCAPAEGPAPLPSPSGNTGLAAPAVIQRDVPVQTGIAADTEDRLYLAMGDAIWVKSSEGEDLGRIEGLENCHRVACGTERLYALQESEESDVLTVYALPSLELLETHTLDFGGKVSCLAALGDQLLVTASEPQEDAAYGGGYRVDPQTGASQEYPCGGTVGWAVAMDNGALFMGGDRMCQQAASWDAVPGAAPWAIFTQAGCRVPGEDVIFVAQERMLGVADWEEKTVVTCMAMPEAILRLAGGSHMLYALLADGSLCAIPWETLALEPTETLTLLLSEIPYNYLERSIADYITQNPGVSIQYELTSSYDMKTKMLAGVDGIDIFAMESRQAELYDYHHAGVLEDLSPYASVQEVLDDPRMIPGALSACKVGEELLCVPTDLRVRAMMVSTRNYEKSGMPAPEAGWDWLDFFDMMDAAACDADGDGVLDGLPFMDYLHVPESGWPVFLEDYLVNYYDAESRSIDFDTPVFRELMERWKSYCEKPWALQRYDPASMEWGAMALQELNIGQGITWVIGGENYTQETFPYTYLPVPRMPVEEGRQSLLALGNNSYMLGLYARSAHKERAADFLAFLIRYEQKHRYDLWYDQAILYEVKSREDYTAPEDTDPMSDEETAIFLERGWDVYAESLPQTVIPCLSYEKQSQLAQIIASYMQGQLTLDELVAELTEKAEMMLR